MLFTGPLSRPENFIEVHDEISAAHKAASTFHAIAQNTNNKLKWNSKKGRRPISATDISKLIIESTHDAFSACRKKYGVHKSKSYKCVEKKIPADSRIFVDSYDADKILEHMKNAVEHWKIANRKV